MESSCGQKDVDAVAKSEQRKIVASVMPSTKREAARVLRGGPSLNSLFYTCNTQIASKKKVLLLRQEN
jgi:hypothetical protein